MKRTLVGMIAGALVWAGASQAAAAQLGATPLSTTTSDDIGADGLKRRGDGSIDDSQSGGSRSDDHGRGRGRGGDRERDDNSGRDDDRDRGHDREKGRDRDRDRDRSRDRD